MTPNGLHLPVVGVWNTQRSITIKGFLELQNFLLPRLRQLLVGAVSGWRFFCPIGVTFYSFRLPMFLAIF